MAFGDLNKVYNQVGGAGSVQATGKAVSDAKVGNINSAFDSAIGNLTNEQNATQVGKGKMDETTQMAQIQQQGPKESTKLLGTALQ